MGWRDGNRSGGGGEKQFSVQPSDSVLMFYYVFVTGNRKTAVTNTCACDLMFVSSCTIGDIYHISNATTTKVAVYKATCISILLYGCETWTPYRRHIKALEAFHMRCLKSILGIRWWHKVTHVETRHRAADIDTAEYMLLQTEATPLDWACNSHAF